MTDSELRRLAYIIVEEQARNKQWMANYALAVQGAQRKTAAHEIDLISTKEAAAMLNLSVSRFRHIIYDEDGNPNFSFVKGDSKQSPLKFDKSVLLDEYKRYLAKRNGEAVNPFLAPRRNIM